MFNRPDFGLITVLIAFVAISFVADLTGRDGYSVKAQTTFTITVKVTDAPGGTGNGISGVNVVLVMNGTTQLSAQTDAGGNCSFTQISGSYEVTPSKPNYIFHPLSQGGVDTGPRTLFFTGSPANLSSSVQFDAFGYPISEGDGRAVVQVFRAGDTSSACRVDYTTADDAGLNNCNIFNGVASSRCDYAVSVGTLTFAAGESLKSISIPIVDDSYAEGSETFSVRLSNPVGTTLGTPTSVPVTINDNETSTGANPISQTAFFVRQHYIDFLGREPDPGGYAGWQATINNCAGGDTNCDRIHVSSSFFRSPEFQDRGYFIYRFYSVSMGRKPDYAEFTPDIAKVSGFLSPAELEAAKVAFIAEFMTRTPFVTKFNGLSSAGYVDTLLATAGITHAARDFWVAALGNGTRTRAEVLREIAESTEVYNKYYTEAFVVMQYFGYLRRDPDAFYLDWIRVLDTSGDSRGMINGFVNSTEYRLRFGP